MAGPRDDPVVISDEEDDEDDLKLAIALSLKDQEELGNPGDESIPETHDEPAVKEVETKPASSGILGFDRKQMEQERLARLAKRRREDDDDQPSGGQPPKKRIETPPAVPTNYTAPLSSDSPAPAASTLPFAKGVVKRTWAYGYPRSPDDIKLEEVLDRAHLELAVLSSFQWDEEWLMSKVDVGRTKLLLVAFADSEAQKQAMRENVPPGIRFCFPPMNGPGSMHSKLQLLKYPTHLRIVVPTGNLVPYDWGETGVMENMLFLIDVPRLANSTSHEPTPFSTQLGHFLRASAIDEKMVSSLLRSYDFSATAGLGFIYSIPGSHSDEARERVGYCGLGSCVAALGMGSSSPVDVDLVCSSLGSINPDLLQAIYNACQGDDGLREYEARVKRKPADKPIGPSQSLIDHFRIYFPTDKTVGGSRGGRGAGGTICARRQWWQAPSFPRQLVRDCINTREGLLMHSKVVFVRRRKSGSGPNASEGQCMDGFAYVGSANLSESAWGRVVKERGTGKPKMTCRNWECGVVLPAARTAPRGSDGLEIFGGSVPVPMRHPGPTYGPNEQPWFFMEG